MLLLAPRQRGVADLERARARVGEIEDRAREEAARAREAAERVRADHAHAVDMLGETIASLRGVVAAKDVEVESWKNRCVRILATGKEYFFFGKGGGRGDVRLEWLSILAVRKRE